MQHPDSPVPSKCLDHGKAERLRYDERRRNDPQRAFYWSPAWRKARTQHLAMEPNCRLCKERGLERTAEQVDHVVGIRDGGDPLDDGNLRSLCASCHSARTSREQSWNR